MKNDKTEVVITEDDRQYNEFKIGEFGYIDGYIRGGDNVPYAVVVIDHKLRMIPFTCLKVRIYGKDTIQTNRR